MRLLNTKSMELKDFIGRPPAYAILSHTWEEEEVLFQDMLSDTASSKLGWTKISKCCEIARRNFYEWVWIDTCCIDKSSSAELSEAINSMFSWYRNSGVCYAFLSDVKHDGFFKNSRWFTRGWTLQELVSPTFAYFFDHSWQMIGTKLSRARELEVITGITQAPLSELMRSSVACKMSWAAKRETTRIEDEAYSLLGLFDISMPLLYGEGKNAFMRLQQEILKSSDDESLLAWVAPPSPACFAKSGTLVRGFFEYRPEFKSTHKGFIMSLTLQNPLKMPSMYSQIQASDLDVRDGSKVDAAILNCCRYGTSEPIALLLRLHDSGVYHCLRPRQSLISFDTPLFDSNSSPSSRKNAAKEVIIAQVAPRSGVERLFPKWKPDIDLVFEVPPGIGPRAFERYHPSRSTPGTKDAAYEPCWHTEEGDTKRNWLEGNWLEEGAGGQYTLPPDYLSSSMTPVSRVLLRLQLHSGSSFIREVGSSFMLLVTAIRDPDDLSQHLALDIYPDEEAITKWIHPQLDDALLPRSCKETTTDYAEIYISRDSGDVRVIARWHPVPTTSQVPGRDRFRIEFEMKPVIEM